MMYNKLQRYAGFEDGNFTVAIDFLFHFFTISYSYYFASKAVKSLFRRFIGYECSGIEVNPTGLMRC